MSSAHLIGQKVGEYEVTRRIGLGGMGAVYEGRHPLIGKRVAIKVLLPQFSQEEAAMKRFLAEARAVNEIRHRGIVDIFAFGELPDGSHYFVMELLEGQSFEALLRIRRSFPPVEALGLMEEVLDAVAAAHQAGVVHRDLKPSNIFLVDVGRGRPFVKLLDFGVAKLTPAGGAMAQSEATGIVGTPIYMSPEQVNGLRAGPEADIYALGVVLFELIAGRPPFTAENPVEMMTRHLDARPPRLSEIASNVSSELDRMVDKMLAKRPQDRPQDAEALRAEVARLKAQLDAPSRRAMSPQQRAALEDDVGPTVVRQPMMGRPTQPDLTPVKNKQVQRDPDRTQVDRVPLPRPSAPSLPWHDGSPAVTLETGDSDRDLGQLSDKDLERELEHPVPTLRPAPTALQPAMDLPVPTLRPNSQSSPTLSVQEDSDPNPSLPPISTEQLAKNLVKRQSGPYGPAITEARVVRASERRQKALGSQVLIIGLAAAAIMLGVLLAWLAGFK